MIRAFLLSLAQLGDARILRVLAKSLALTFVLCLLPGITLWFVLRSTTQAGAGFGALLAVTASLLSLWLLFRAVAVAVVGIFADDIVAAVEARHYPAATATPVPLARSVAMGLRSAARAVAVNALMLPVYVVLLATGIGTPIAFLAVNGWLLARDLGDMVAARHLPATDMRAWRRTTTGPRLLLGTGNAAMFLIPVVNLLAPVLGAAMATHLFHRSRR